MTTIPPVAARMHLLLTDEADHARRHTGFVQHSDATLTGSGFAQTRVFGLGADAYAT